MKTKSLKIALFLIIANCIQISAQTLNSINIRDTLFNFLVSKSDFVASQISRQTILINIDIISLEDYKNQEFGIFKFKTLTSHTYFHFLLIEINKYTIIDMAQPYENIMLILLDYFQRNPQFSKEEVLKYLKSATEVYLRI